MVRWMMRKEGTGHLAVQLGDKGVTHKNVVGADDDVGGPEVDESMHLRGCETDWTFERAG